MYEWNRYRICISSSVSLVGFFIFYFMSKARDDQCTKRSCYGSIKHIVREGKIDSHINEVSVSEKKKRTKKMINRKKNKRSKISIVPLEFRERILYPENVCTIKMNNTLYKIYIYTYTHDICICINIISDLTMFFSHAYVSARTFNPCIRASSSGNGIIRSTIICILYYRSFLVNYPLKAFSIVFN